MKEQLMALVVGLGLVFASWTAGLACVYYASQCTNASVSVWFFGTGLMLGGFTIPLLMATCKTVADIRGEQRNREQQQ